MGRLVAGDPLERRSRTVDGANLEVGLAAQGDEPFRPQPVDRLDSSGQGGPCRYAGGLQPRDLRPAGTGDQMQRVLVTPLLVAHAGELAELAVGARHRPRVDVDVGADDPTELLAQAPPVGLDIGEPDRLGVSGAEMEVGVLGRASLDGGEGLGVEAQLQDVAGLGLGAGELGVERLVAEGAERRRLVDADEEVGHATEPVMDQRELVDDVVAGGEDVADSLRPLGERLSGMA